MPEDNVQEAEYVIDASPGKKRSHAGGNGVIAALLVFLMILLAGLGALVYEDLDDDGDSSSAGSGGGAGAEWTFMVYLDADNNLEGPGIEDLNEMEEAGSTGDVNIIVLIDRCEGEDSSNGDWTDWRYYYVLKDPDGANNEIISKELNYPHLEEGAEPNMGDPQTLVDFCTYTMKEFPAEHYLLSLWNHGGGIRGVCWDDSTDDHDNLDLQDLDTALAAIHENTGERIDVVGYDACLMGGASIHYQINEYVDNTVASEATESGDGWPYELILADEEKGLVNNPSMTPGELSRNLVEFYVESYGVTEPWVTQAAFRNEEMLQVYEDMDVFAQALMAGLPEYQALIWDARENTENYDLSKETPYMPEVTGYPMCDLWDFMDELVKHIPWDEDLMNAITALKNSISAARIAYGSGTDMPDSHGLSIYFPAENDPSGEHLIPSSYRADLYEPTKFAQDHLWDDFLRTYYFME